MTVRLRHIGCESVIVVYHGEEPLESNPRLRSKDWALPDGSRMTPNSALLLVCRDCEATVMVNRHNLEPIPRKVAT